MDSILVRNEYRQLLNHITELHKQLRGGVVLLGQPGIGKSLFLYYILLYRIFHSKPTAFESTPQGIFFFGETFKRLDKIDPEGYPDAWALSDSNYKLMQPSESFTQPYSRFFLVQATSPQLTRWQGWPKYRDAEMVTMNLWSWEEIYTGPTQFQTWYTPVHVEVLSHVFKNFSQSARRCYELVRDCETVSKLEGSRGYKGFEGAIDLFIQNPPSPSILRRLVSEFLDEREYGFTTILRCHCDYAKSYT